MHCQMPILDGCGLRLYFNYMFGDDEHAIDFWKSPDAEKIGRGGTPNAAVLDLIDRHSVVGQLEYDG